MKNNWDIKAKFAERIQNLLEEDKDENNKSLKRFKQEIEKFDEKANAMFALCRVSGAFDAFTLVEEMAKASKVLLLLEYEKSEAWKCPELGITNFEKHVLKPFNLLGMSARNYYYEKKKIAELGEQFYIAAERANISARDYARLATLLPETEKKRMKDNGTINILGEELDLNTATPTQIRDWAYAVLKKREREIEDYRILQESRERFREKTEKLQEIKEKLETEVALLKGQDGDKKRVKQMIEDCREQIERAAQILDVDVLAEHEDLIADAMGVAEMARERFDNIHNYLYRLIRLER